MVPVSASATGSDAKAPPPVDLGRWWQALGDPELDSLVERAVKANPDLQIALDRLQAARTYEAGIYGTVLPEAEATAGGGRGTGSNLSRGRASQELGSAT